MMLKLISCVLSFALIFTSVTPSLAQVPVRQTLRSGVKAAKGAVHPVSPTLRPTNLPPLTQEALLRNAQFSLALPHASLLSGSSLPKSRQILTQADAAQRALLLRADFPVLILNGQVPVQDMHQAVQFYRAQLTNPENVLDKLPTSGELLSAEQAQPVVVLVADVAGVGLVGVPTQDAPLVLNVYEKSIGTAAEPLMTAVCARALLRLQAYDTLAKMAATSTQQPELWEGIEQYAQIYGLPLQLAKHTRHAVDIRPFEDYMAALGPLNKLVVRPEAQSTFLYMNVARTPQAAEKAIPSGEVAATAQPQHAFVNQKPIQPIMEAPKVQAPQASLPNPSNSQRYRPVEIVNALGNKVQTWEPVAPEVPAVSSSSRSLSWLDKARLQWAVRVKPAFENLFTLGSSRYGIAALGVGLSPLTSEAVIAQAGPRVELVQQVRAQQGTFIAEDFLRGGAGAAYRMGVVNPGGLAAQRYGQVLLKDAQPTLEKNIAGAGYVTPQTVQALETYFTQLHRSHAYHHPEINIAASWLIPPIWRKVPLFRTTVQRANQQAINILTQQYPLVSALKNILTSQAGSVYKREALLKLYQLGYLTNILQKLPKDTRKQLREAIEQKDWDYLGGLLFALYKTGVISAKVQDLVDENISATLLEEVGNIVNTPEFRAQAAARYNQQEVLPAAEGSFEGDVPLPAAADIDAIASTFRSQEGFVIPEGEDRGDTVFYAKDVPFYYRNSKGQISPGPVGVLSQEQAGVLNKLLSAVPFQLFADKAGFYIPKGFVLVLDEQGQWKLMMPPGNLSIVESVPASKKLWESIKKNGSKHIAVDIPYASGNLLAMAKMLDNNPDLRLQLTLNAPSSFRQFLTFFGIYIGMDSANSLTGPYKKTMSVTAELGWPATMITNIIGGFGYVSPWIGGWALKWMTKWGYAKSIMSLFGVAGAALLTSWAVLGMDGWSQFPQMVNDFKANPQDMGLLLSLAGQLALPLTVAVITGSLFGVLVPIILNIYKDPTARTAANLKFATTKQWSRLGLTGLTALLGMEAIGGDWTIMVPFATAILGVSALLFYNTPIMKNATKEREKVMTEKKKQEQEWLAQGLDPKQMEKEQAARLMQEKKEFKAEYSQKFRHTPEVDAIVSRVRGVYWAYAASLMMIGQIVNELLGTSKGQWMTSLFMLATVGMRTYAKNKVEDKSKTDDQFTGLSIPLLAGSAALLAVMPYEVAWVGVLTALVAAAHYVGTAVPGQLDNTRMQNMVSAMIQEEKQAIKDDTNLTEAQKEELLEKIKRKEKEWASLASSSYSYANGFGEFGVLIAAALGLVFMDKGLFPSVLEGVRDGLSWMSDAYATESNGFTMQRLVFLMSAGLLGRLSIKNWDLTKDFLRSLKKTNITAENIAMWNVSAGTFGISEKNAAQNLTKVNKELDKLKEKMLVFGIVSEKKMTDMYNLLTVNYNRLIAIQQVGGNSRAVDVTFNKLLELAGTLRTLLNKHKMSVMLEREFDQFARTISVDGQLKEMVANPGYVPEGVYHMPNEYQRFEDSKHLVQELNVLAGRISLGQGVQSDTYKLFIEYYSRVKENLAIYSKLNVADSNRVLALEQEMDKICMTLKRADQETGLLQTNKSSVPTEDVQALRDMLEGVASFSSTVQGDIPLQPAPAY